jgi:hypothetical protein
MNLEPKEWIALASLIATLGIFIYTRNMLARADVSKQLADHDLKLTQIEGRLQNVPTLDAFHKLELMVTRVEGHQKVFEAELKPMGASIARIEKFLIDQAATKVTRK